MGFTLTSTNYNGTIREMLYLIHTLGAETVASGAVEVLTGIRSKKELRRMSAAVTAEPFTTGEPNFSSSVTEKSRDLEVQKALISMKIDPNVHFVDWEKYASVNNLTNLAMNPIVLREGLALIEEGYQEIIDKAWWQGDTASGDANLKIWDGLEKLLDADSDTNVLKPTLSGGGTPAIDATNVFDILKACDDIIPDRLRPYAKTAKARKDLAFYVNYALYNLIDWTNKQSNKEYLGLLGRNRDEQLVFNNIPIIPLPNISDNRIIGADGFDNFKAGVYYSPDNEYNGVSITKDPNGSMLWSMVVRFTGGINYVYGGDVISYKGV